MDYINIYGDENAVISKLSEYVNKGGAKLIIQTLPLFTSILCDDEIFEKEEKIIQQENKLDFILPKTNYYINLKMSTIAFIGLLFDIKFTKGFASFVLSTFGISADSIRKLTNTEKCILFFIKSNSITNEGNEYTFIGTPNCINFVIECTHRQYNKCILSKEIINNTIKNMIHKNIISQSNEALICNF